MLCCNMCWVGVWVCWCVVLVCRSVGVCWRMGVLLVFFGVVGGVGVQAICIGVVGVGLRVLVDGWVRLVCWRVVRRLCILVCCVGLSICW